MLLLQPRIFLVVAATLAVAGCVRHWPQTPDEFRREAPTAMFGTKEEKDVGRPLREVGKTFQSKARQCLGVTVKMTEGARTVYRTFKPTVVVKGDRVELYVQQTYAGNVVTPGSVPEGGAYYLVADGTPLDGGRTHLVLYGSSIGSGKLLMKAITGWASGEQGGCPDLTQ